MTPKEEIKELEDKITVINNRIKELKSSLGYNTIYFDNLTAKILKEYNVTIQDIVGRSKKYSIVKCRHVLIYLLRENTELTLNEIGKLVGNRHHATIIFAISNVRGYVYVNDESILDMINFLTND